MTATVGLWLSTRNRSGRHFPDPVGACARGGGGLGKAQLLFFCAFFLIIFNAFLHHIYPSFFFHEI